MAETLRGRAEALGLEVYDTALPQPWVDQAYAETGIYPVSHFVWCYDDFCGQRTTFGYPAALTREGVACLALLENRKEGGEM